MEGGNMGKEEKVELEDKNMRWEKENRKGRKGRGNADMKGEGKEGNK